jgi:formamidopyrimidine-DNA glycosylase
MPELAEVAYYAKIWSPAVGAKVLDVHVNADARVFRDEAAAAFSHGLKGRKFAGHFTHGKNMLFQFSPGFWLGGHLGMTGELRCGPADTVPEKHDHLVLFFKDHALTFRDPRKFGRLRLHEGKAPPPWWSELPPGILTEAFTIPWLTNFLQRHRKAPLKALLLDQTGFPGIGNWMADEILWRMKLPPATPAGNLERQQIQRLHTALRSLCRQALKTIGETWADPPDSWLFNHRWKNGGRCPRCRTALVREDLRGRTTCWCPECQV